MTGKTVEEAVEAACAALELLRDEVSVEVIEMPQKRLFGFIPAKVRVYVSDDAFSVKDLLKSQDEHDGDEKNLEKQHTEDIAKPEEAFEIPLEKTGKSGENTETNNQEQQQTELPKKPDNQSENEIPFDRLPESAKSAFSYLKDVAYGMQAKELSFRAVGFDEGIKFLIDGEDAAMLIGRRGETMDALQYLCLLVSNRANGEYCKISIDVADYRGKRERTLQALAKRVAGKVLKSRRSQTLEPMNPYERRIVHSTIQEIDGVKSESVGDDPNRRVVVFIEGDTPRPYRSRDDAGRSGTRRRSGDARERDRGMRRDDHMVKTQEKPIQAKPQDPELEKNLYGKIEF